MKSARIPSPSRSQCSVTPRRHQRRTRSVGSPATSVASGRLTAIVEGHMGSFVLSPLLGRRSVLTDNTDIEEPRRQSWWKQLGDNSRDVMEVLEVNNVVEPNNIIEELDIEVLSQEKRNYTLDLPESSDSESINSIVIPQRKLFTQKENQPQKKFGEVMGTRETLTKLHKTNEAGSNKTINVNKKDIFQNKQRSKPMFPAALLNITANKTADKSKELVAIEPKGQVRNIFGNRPATKRKNMFTNFIASESEDEIPDIQPKVFGFQKKTETKRRGSSASRGIREPSPTSSITTDIEMDDWKLLPSSTMVDNQLEAMMAEGNTPIKRAKRSKLSEIKETDTNDQSKQSNKSVTAKNVTRTISKEKSPLLNKSVLTRSRLKASQNEAETANNSQREANVSKNKTLKQNQSKKITKEVEKAKFINKSNIEKTVTEPVNASTSNKSKNKSLPLTQKSLQNNQEMEVDGNIEDIETSLNISREILTRSKKKTLQDPALNEDNIDQDPEKLQTNSKSLHNISKTSITSKKDKSQNKSKSQIKLLTQKENTNMDIDDAEILEEKSDQELNLVYEEGDNLNEERVNNKKDKSKENQNEPNVIETSHRNDGDDQDSHSVKNDQNQSHLTKNQNKGQLIIKDSQEMEQSQEGSPNNENEVVEVRQEVEVDLKTVNKNQEMVALDKNQEVANEESQEVQHEESQEMEVAANEDESQEVINEKESQEAVSEEKIEETNESQEVEVAEESEEENQEEENADEESQEVENEDESQEVENEEESQEVENEEESQEIENEEESQEVENEEESQEIENEEECQEVENEEESQEIENEEESQEAEAEEESQEVENEEVNESQEVEDAEESQDIENAESSQEMDDAEVSQEVDDEEENDENDEEIQEVEEEGQEHRSQDINDSQEEHNDSSEMDNDVADDSDIEENESEHEVEADGIEEENEEVVNETPNVSHDTTGRHRKKNASPEVILHEKTNQVDSFAVHGRNTSVRKTKSMIRELHAKPSLAPIRGSISFSDGTKNSSAEGSGWDSHRITRKSIRQTFGKGVSPKKSLRAMVMEKSAKRQTLASETAKFPMANSTELPEASNYVDDFDENRDPVESDHELSRRTRQTTLEMYLQKIKQDNMEKKAKMEEAVRNSIKTQPKDIYNPFKVPTKPPPRRLKPQNKPKPKQTKTALNLEDMPEELIEDLQYKPPKRFRASSAPWITKRLYKFLESKLEPKYDYKARVRAEKLVETIFQFTKELRRAAAAPPAAVAQLKAELARLKVVHTHFEFYEFFHQYMPREVRIKVVPDVTNKIPLPRHGVFSEIIREQTTQG